MKDMIVTRSVIIMYTLCCLLFVLPGCRYIEWGRDVFYQSEKRCSYTELRDEYIRSLRIYDQLTTLALFDVVWLSEPIRRWFSQEYALLYGCAPETILCEQLEENMLGTSFYVLAATPHNVDYLLSDTIKPWTLYMKVDGECYKPSSLKEVELPYIYRIYFGLKYSAAKKVYLVKFPATVPAGSSPALCFHRVGRLDECVVWDRIGSEIVLDYHGSPDELAYDLK